jgi:hypothetical protein
MLCASIDIYDRPEPSSDIRRLYVWFYVDRVMVKGQGRTWEPLPHLFFLHAAQVIGIMELIQIGVILRLLDVMAQM